MRRIVAIAVLLTAVSYAVLASGASGGGGDYRIDAIFDNVAFLQKGQNVRIAGANAGKVTDLEVTKDHKARVSFEIEDRFAPFRADADCTIQPQSLIGERFVQCTPGTPSARELEKTDDHPPTVPVANTHAPVDIDLVLGTLDRPTRERLGILVGSLGAGLAARGQDLNETIRRANPALQETRKLIELLAADRDRLRSLITDSDTVLAELGRRRERVADFVEQAAAVTETTAERRERLAELIRRLPPFLDEARPALARLTEFARDGTPLARDLERGAPDLRRVLARTSQVADQLLPTLRRLRPVLAQTRRALPDIAPQLRRLTRFGDRALPAGRLLTSLLDSMYVQGAIDGLMGLFYYGSAATARFDRFSHMLPAYPINSPCSLYAKTTDPACSALYPGAAGTRAAAQETRSATAAPRQGTEAPSPVSPPARPAEPAPAPAPSAPAQKKGLGDTVNSAVDNVKSGRVDRAVQDLLGFLLG